MDLTTMTSRLVGMHVSAKKTEKLDAAFEDKRHRAALAALADVDARRTPEHTEVDRWKKTLERRKRGRGLRDPL